MTTFLTEEAIATLVDISVRAPAPIQCMTLRIFQNMLHMKVPLERLNSAVKNMYKLVSEIKDYSESKIKFGSDFWQFLFNQIYITTEAQLSNAL